MDATIVSVSCHIHIVSFLYNRSHCFTQKHTKKEVYSYALQSRYLHKPMFERTQEVILKARTQICVLTTMLLNDKNNGNGYFFLFGVYPSTMVSFIIWVGLKKLSGPLFSGEIEIVSGRQPDTY